MSKLEVDTIAPQSGTTVTVGESGDTVTIPTGVTLDASNATTTLPANVVTTDGTQTLTNKTIDASQLSGTITPSDGTVTNAKVNASAAIDYSKLNLTGNIALADLSATGTKDATTFLRGDNTFATAGGGDTVLLHTATGSDVSSIDINGYFTSDYDHYKLIYSVYAATNNTDTMVRIMQGGSVITASNYWFAGNAWYYDGTYSQSSNAVGFNTNYIGIASTDNTSNSQYPTTGEMLLSNPLSTSQNTTITTNSIGYNSGAGAGQPPTAIRTWNYAGTYISTTATSGISFGYIGGNINGTIRLYGMKNS